LQREREGVTVQSLTAHTAERLNSSRMSVRKERVVKSVEGERKYDRGSRVSERAVREGTGRGKGS
jgi:hypothetical protein